MVDDGVLLVVRGDRIYYSVLSRYSHYALFPPHTPRKGLPSAPRSAKPPILVWGGL